MQKHSFYLDVIFLLSSKLIVSGTGQRPFIKTGPLTTAQVRLIEQELPDKLLIIFYQLIVKLNKKIKNIIQVQYD